MNEAARTDDIINSMGKRKALKADFICDHPTFDKCFWILSQKNPVRCFCQLLVRPTGCERMNGHQPSTIAHATFQLVLPIAVIMGVAIVSIATPMSCWNYYMEYARMRGSWFDIAESTFGLMLPVEFITKTTAVYAKCVGVEHLERP